MLSVLRVDFNVNRDIKPSPLGRRGTEGRRGGGMPYHLRDTRANALGMGRYGSTFFVGAERGDKATDGKKFTPSGLWTDQPDEDMGSYHHGQSILNTM